MDEDECGPRTVSGELAAILIRRRLAEGLPVEIPSLGIMITAPRCDLPITRTHKGRVVADWRLTDWLRAWLEERELWDLLDSLAPGRLERFGRIVQAMRDADVDG